MRVLVLGAGVVGVTSAWYLAADGHEVSVIERQAGPALETSFANGGQISVSHAEPWANPRAPMQILKWLFQEESPLLWRLRADSAQWAWGWQFLKECTQARSRDNMRALVELGVYSRHELQALRAQLSLDYDQRTAGILHVYTDQNQFDAACEQASWMQRFGCERLPVDRHDVQRIEPALTHAELSICGGTFTQHDESGDAQQFTTRLATQAAQAGVTFHYGRDVTQLHRRGGLIESVELAGGERLSADAVVVACGSYSRHLLDSVGVRLPIYPAKGYSVTFSEADDLSSWPSVSLTDDECKIVISRLGNRLRAAGTAEFTGYDVSINARRCAAIQTRVERLIPALRTATSHEYWAGLRPAMPGNVPCIGRSPLSNLWVNAGHGTLGWTLACGSARLLADQMSGCVSGRVSGREPGRKTAITADAYQPSRYQP
jgi:D-amino-acid dehydrogenase